MGYILNFQNNSNNMKNEIIRKITSLTLMTIMFAGGLTLAAPSFIPMEEILPAAYAANEGTTEGTLYMSSTEVSGAQVIQIIVDDPAIADVSQKQTGAIVDISVGGGSTFSLIMTQVTNGTWEGYLVDGSAATDADSGSFQFGTPCTTTLTFAEGLTDNGLNYSFLEADDCTDPNGGSATAFNVVGSESTVRQPVLTDDGGVVYTGDTVGQVGHDTVSWPVIWGVDLGADNILVYGDDSITFTYGPENAGSDLIINNGNPFVVQGQNVSATIVDNALNIDPTTAETWTFTSVTGTTAVARTTGASTDIRATLGITGFGDNGVLAVTDSDTAICADNTSGCGSVSTYVFVETGTNTGVFEAHDALGESVIDIKGDAGVDEVVTICMVALAKQSQ